MKLRRTRTLSPCWAACVMYSGFMPSMEIMTTEAGVVWAARVPGVVVRVSSVAVKRLGSGRA